LAEGEAWRPTTFLRYIEPVVFGAAKDRNIQRACELAVEGGDLIDRPEAARLNMLGSFKSDQTESLEHVKAVLEKYHVRLHTAEQIECIVDEIDAPHTSRRSR
jgi:hypothetical protein